MFKIESYVTPYILAYLGKYFKNFDPADFQMSLWGGGAVFQNLNLDLQVLDKELNLPVTFVSGHIHDLKIAVPWTKLTSEPIQVSINTIAVTLKLKPPPRNEDAADNASGSDAASTYSTNLAKSYPEDGVNSSGNEAAPPPGYMQNLISRIWNNVQFKFENVIVKYVEEDVVLSLNFKEANFCTVNENWERAFIDLVYPDFILRKKFMFQDLTVCLDRANNLGKIESYQGPFLYRCAFEIRIFKMFKSALSKTARFTRMDFHFDEMNFTMTVEQVPTLIRLYMQIMSFYQTRVNVIAAATSAPPSRTDAEELDDEGNMKEERNEELLDEKERSDGEDDVEGGGVADAAEREDSNLPKAGEGEDGDGNTGWGAWALSWIPPVSTLLGAEFEDDDVNEEVKPEKVEEESEPATVVCHYRVYVNKCNVNFKAERSGEGVTASGTEKNLRVQKTESEESSVTSTGSILSDTDLTPDKSRNSSQNSQKPSPDAKATCWAQLTVGVVAITISGANLAEDGLPFEKMECEIKEIVSTFDIQAVFLKWTHKVESFRVLNYERVVQPYASMWKRGKTLGIVVTSENEITRDIVQHNGDFNRSGASLPISNSRKSSVDRRGAGAETAGSHSSQKPRPCLSLTFTKAQCSNYHQKLGIPSPLEIWTSSVYKYSEKDYDLYAPIDSEERRYLSEIDVQLKALDFVFNPEVFVPYTNILDKLLQALTLSFQVEEEQDVCLVPVWNNNTLPLIYVETEALRLFLKGETKNRRDNLKCNVPDFILLECSSVNFASHNENPLSRTILSPFLFQIGEKARILSIPGSPVEDRHYQVEVHGVAAQSGVWEHVWQRSESEKSSVHSAVAQRRNTPWPGVLLLPNEASCCDVVNTLPLLEHLEISLGIAPAIVYQREVGSNCKSHVVAGHAVELNLVSDIKLTISVNQLEGMKQLWQQMFNVIQEMTKSSLTQGSVGGGSQRRLLHDSSPPPQSPFPTFHSKSGSTTGKSATGGQSARSITTTTGSQFSGSTSGSLKEGDSGIGSLVTTSNLGISLRTRSQTKLLFKRKKSLGKPPASKASVDGDATGGGGGGVVGYEEWHKHSSLELVPFDFLLSSGIINVIIYDVICNNAHDVEIVVPLCSVMVMQPHVICSLTQHFQKFEISVFELLLKLGSNDIKSSWIPDQKDFDQNVFDSIPGERDPKTGLIPPLLNFKIVDFISRPCTVICDIKRPIKVEANRIKLDTLLHAFGLLFDRGGSPLEAKLAHTKLVKNTPEVIEQNRLRKQRFREALGKVGTINISCSQCVLALVEEPAVITWSWSSASMNSMVKSNFHGVELREEAESWNAIFTFKSIAASTKLKERTSLLIAAFNASCDLKCVWTPWVDYQMLTFCTQLEPVTMYCGPQNILCMQQIQKTFQEYIDEVNIVEDEIVEIMEQEEPTGTKMIFDSFEDDLRAGSFKFVRVPSALDLPQVYQIAFCDAQRTMTWRYPQFRVLTSVEASPVPIDYERNPAVKNTLECVIEYWDAAMCDFRYFGKFTLSETSGASVRGTPIKDKLHMYNSNIWRIKIVTPLEEADSIQLVRPEILAACLKVDSIHDSSLVPKLKVFIEVPRISVHLVNNFYFGGRGLNQTLPQYSNKAVSQFDQTFATITLEANSLLLSVWLKHCSIDVMSYIEGQVLDYEFLTMIPVLDPSLLNYNVCLYNSGHAGNSVDINSQVEVIWKELTVKLGASSLHTLLSSWTSWTQILEAWDGNGIRLREDLHNMESVNVNQILVFNTLSSEIRFQQSGADSSLFVEGGACVPFFWATNKHKPVCKLGLKEKDWAFDCSFDLKKMGYIVRNIHRKPVFVHVTNFSGMQRLVTISSSLFVGNALHKNVEVAALPTNKSVEIRWQVGKRGFGSSQLLSLSEIDHFRFRIVKDPNNAMGQAQPWSGVITPGDFKDRASENGAVCMQLFEEKDGKLETFCVWCSLVEEVLEETMRFLIILSPYFRIKSFLPSETLVHVSTAKQQSSRVDYKLKGMGHELEIDFTGNHATTHHLTLQSSPLGSSSTPSIPLLPEGPVLKMPAVSRPIDEILSKISGVDFGDCFAQQEQLDSSVCAECTWPFVSEPLIAREEWNVCEQPKTELGVEFTPWIEGVPTVLLKFRPWALLVNLTADDLYFSQSTEFEKADVGEWERSLIPPKSVFSPAKMSFDSGRLVFGMKLKGELVLSDKLRLSEEKRRTDIHLVNTDLVIPVDSFSRLDLLSQTQNQIGYLTIETRLREKMLVITVRPTYSIINKTSSQLFVQSVAISSNSQQTRGFWTDEKLSSYYSLPENGKEEGIPLLRFCTDGNNDYTPGRKSVKYLALSCGGPWWFVKLMDFSVIFDNMNSSQGVLAAAVSANVPKYGAGYEKSNTLILEDSEFEAVTVPVVVSWTCKNGQVWISITPESCPQLFVHNSTAVSFLYVQSLRNEMIPLQETDYFEQYLILPPNCKGHYTFPRKYMELLHTTTLSSAEQKAPNLLLAKLPQDLKEFMASSTISLSPTSSAGSACNSDMSSDEDVRRRLKRFQRIGSGHGKRKDIMGEMVQRSSFSSEGEKMPSGNLIIPGITLKWTKLLQLEVDSSQYVSFGEFVDTKISIEKVGFSFYVYIENMSNVEVAAKDVRKRIMNQSISQPTLPVPPPPTQENSPPQPITPAPSRTASPAESEHLVKPFDSMASIDFEQIGALVIAPAGRPPPINDDASPPFEMHCFLPKLTVIVTDDMTSATERRQLISFTLEDVVLEQIPQPDYTKYRALFDRSKGKFLRRECYIISAHIGDVQVDSPCCPCELTCDFPVILKQVGDFETPPVERAPWRKYKDQKPSPMEGEPMIKLVVNYGQSSLEYKSIESIYVKAKPFFLNVEDRLLDHVLPSLQSIYNVAAEQFRFVKRVKANSVGVNASRAFGIEDDEEEDEDLYSSSLDLTAAAGSAVANSSGAASSTAAASTTAATAAASKEMQELYPVKELNSKSTNAFEGISGIVTHPHPTPTQSPGHSSRITNLANPSPFVPVKLSSVDSATGLALVQESTAKTTIPSSPQANPYSTSKTKPTVPNSLSISPSPSPNKRVRVRTSSGDVVIEMQKDVDLVVMTSSWKDSSTAAAEDGEYKGRGRVQFSLEISHLLENFSNPILLESLLIENLELCLTLRIAKLLYLAVDHSRVKIPEFRANSAMTTTYHLGQALSAHYTTGAIFQLGNPMRLIGSLELLGSPGSLVESVGGGLKDFVVYPYQGIFLGPTGFISGLGNGVTSLVKSITSGALTSVTNWAWSVSRNIDKLTLDEEEQYLTEAGRRVQLEGFTDGLVQGLTGFGIRLLGAIGGIAHHPIQNVIQKGASPGNVLQGVGRGVVGMVTRPIGGLVELVALTGQGVLRSAGWTPQFKTKGDTLVEEIWTCSNSLLKYQLALALFSKGVGVTEKEGEEDDDEDEGERFVLLIDAVQPCSQTSCAGKLKPISLLLSNRNLYLIDVGEDMAVSHFPVTLLNAEVTEDRNLICLKTAPPKAKDDMSYVKERIMDFVATAATVTSSAESQIATESRVPSPMTSWDVLIGPQAPPPPAPTSDQSSQMFTAISGSAVTVESSRSSICPIFIAQVDKSSGGGGCGGKEKLIGHYVVSPHDKAEFETVLDWLKRNLDNQFFYVDI